LKLYCFQIYHFLCFACQFVLSSKPMPVANRCEWGVLLSSGHNIKKKDWLEVGVGFVAVTNGSLNRTRCKQVRVVV
jgi:hypothetical protein